MNHARAQRNDSPPFPRAPGRRLGAGLRRRSRSTTALRAHADDLKKRHKAAILLWMGGGPATIDIWDLKPGAPTGGTFKPIATTGGEQICEHLPLMAKQMQHLSIVRSMSTREADHNRGRYYMHTGYVPNPNVEHPGYGSVVSHMLAEQTQAVATGDSAVRLGRRRQRRPRLPGHDLRPVRRQLRRQRAQPENGWRPRQGPYRLSQRMQMLASLEKELRQQEPRPVGRRPRQGAGQDRRPDDQQADGRLQGEPRKAKRSARRYGKAQLRPRLPDGPAAGRAGRAVRRSRPGRLGHAHRTTSRRWPTPSCPSWTRP